MATRARSTTRTRAARARKPAAPRLSEANFQRQVTEYATLTGWRWSHWPDSRRVQGNPGCPDLVMVRDGRVVFAELKTERGRLRPSQIEWYTDLFRAPGIEVYVWRPSKWLEIESTLR